MKTDGYDSMMTPCWTPFRCSRALTVTALLALLFLWHPALAQAQFGYSSDNDTLTITDYTGPGGQVVVPATIDGWPVTRIGDFAFNFKNLTGITLPDGLLEHFHK